jgi:hypothetical protein
MPSLEMLTGSKFRVMVEQPWDLLNALGTRSLMSAVKDVQRIGARALTRARVWICFAPLDAGSFIFCCQRLPRRCRSPSLRLLQSFRLLLSRTICEGSIRVFVTWGMSVFFFETGPRCNRRFRGSQYSLSTTNRSNALFKTSVVSVANDQSNQFEK